MDFQVQIMWRYFAHQHNAATRLLHAYMESLG